MQNGTGASEIIQSMIVTIDGPAGSGKSTTASLLADRLGLTYLDTGAMYRAVTYAVLSRGVDSEDSEAVSRVAAGLDIELRANEGRSVILLGGEEIEDKIRSPEISSFVSPVSRHVGVRNAMVRHQRRIGADGGIVVEGRDTGTVVFPYAQIKVFLVADIEARSMRRQKQLLSLGIEQDIAEIRENIAGRDNLDSSRKSSPLLRPPGSIIVDTSNLTIEEQVGIIEAEVRREAERLEASSIGEHGGCLRMSFYYRVSRIFVRTLFRVFFGLKIFGERNIRFEENYIFASNHTSYADPPVVGCALNREVSFIAKSELFRNRAFAWLIDTYHAIPVDRYEIGRKTLKLIIEKLRNGESILMFPEGTRSSTGDMGSFKAGLGFLALQTGSGIVPVYVRGTDRLLKCFFRLERLEIRIGPPIRINEAYVPEDRRMDYRTINSMVLNEMRMLKDEAET